MIFLFFYVFPSKSIYSIGFVRKVPTLNLNDVIHYDNGKLTILYPCKRSTTCSSLHLILPFGKYKFEVWGASGGDTDQAQGGRGGYSYGTISLPHNTNIFVNIGGKGTFTSTTERQVSQPGGFNGGGDGLSEKKSEHFYFGAGGGASDIRLRKNTLNHRVIVAGGGGGAGKTDADGGFGGGKEGGRGTFSASSHYQCIVSGGNQTAPGISQNLTGDQIFYHPSYYHEATFGYGGSILKTDVSGWSSGGGGGGWYGGARGCVYSSSGAGGSGFAFSESSSVPDEYALEKEYYMTDYDTVDGSEEFDVSPLWNNTQTLNGNGAVRITFLDVPSLIFDNILTCQYSRISIWITPITFFFFTLK